MVKTKNNSRVQEVRTEDSSTGTSWCFQQKCLRFNPPPLSPPLQVLNLSKNKNFELKKNHSGGEVMGLRFTGCLCNLSLKKKKVLA